MDLCSGVAVSCAWGSELEVLRWVGEERGKAMGLPPSSNAGGGGEFPWLFTPRISKLLVVLLLRDRTALHAHWPAVLCCSFPKASRLLMDKKEDAKGNILLRS